jgi:hypothetical protein
MQLIKKLLRPRVPRMPQSNLRDETPRAYNNNNDGSREQPSCERAWNVQGGCGIELCHSQQCKRAFITLGAERPVEPSSLVAKRHTLTASQPLAYVNSMYRSGARWPPVRPRCLMNCSITACMRRRPEAMASVHQAALHMCRLRYTHTCKRWKHCITNTNTPHAGREAARHADMQQVLTHLGLVEQRRAVRHARSLIHRARRVQHERAQHLRKEEQQSYVARQRLPAHCMSHNCCCRRRFAVHPLWSCSCEGQLGAVALMLALS